MENKLYRWGMEFPLFVQYLNNQPETSLHTHKFVELVAVSGGSGTHLTPAGSTPLCRGDVFVIPRGMAHGYSPDPESGLAIYNLFFIPEKLPMPQLDLYQSPAFRRLFTPGVFGVTEYPLFHVYDDNEMNTLEQLFREMISESNSLHMASHTCRIALMMQLMCRLSRIYVASEKNDKKDSTSGYLNEIKEYLKNHFREDCPTARLAKMANMSKSNFLKHFKISTGISPLQYILNLRLHEACRQLTVSEQNISEIAFSVGFNDSNYFTRIFHQHIGVSPRAYRKQHSIVPQFLKTETGGEV